MEANARTVRKILHSGDQYVIPLFQRYYSWERKHWKRLRDDVWALMEDGTDGQHFLGPLVCTPCKTIPGEVPSYQLIDGQQRLTTLTVMLAALRDVSQVLGYDKLARKVMDSYLIHGDEEGIQRYKVVPRVGDREALIGIIEGNIPANAMDLNVVQAWEYFKQQIESLAAREGEDGLNRLLSAISGQLSLVVITIALENPYEIFESLNSTGLPLEESDLIRNFIFMQVPLADQQKFDEQCWKPFERLFEERNGEPELPQTAFYRSFLMRRGNYSKAKATFVDFKGQYLKREMDPKDQVSELTRFVRFELSLRRPGTFGHHALRERLLQIPFLDITTAHPLLLALMDLHDRGTLDDDAMRGCIADLASFVIRRSICNDSTRPYSRWFPEAIRSIENDPRADLQKYWLRRGWPDDNSFIANLQQFPLYRREQKKCRLILEELERSYGHKEKVDLGTLTIEHVMPQTIDDDQHGRAWMAMLGGDWGTTHTKWLHTLGNLTLSGYNPELSKRPFDYKRSILGESKLTLNEYFADLPAWDEQAIRHRGELLARKVAQLWPRPVDGPYPSTLDGGPGRKSGSVRKRRLRAYWTQFNDRLRQRDPNLALPSVDAKTSLEFFFGVPGAKMWTWFRRQERLVGITLKRRAGKAIFKALQEDREAIEQEIGEPLKWDAGNACYVSIAQPGKLLRMEADWPNQHAWLMEKLVAFKTAFVPRIQKLHADNLGQGDTDPPEPGELTETRRLQLEYWQALRDLLLARKSIVKPHEPRPQSWTTFAIGRSGFGLHCTASLSKRWIRVGMSCHGKLAKPRFHQLASEKKAIEAETGSSLDWEELPHRIESRISLRQSDVDPADRQDWPRQHAWLAETLEKFFAALSPRIKALNVNDEAAERE